MTLTEHYKKRIDKIESSNDFPRAINLLRLIARREIRVRRAYDEAVTDKIRLQVELSKLRGDTDD